MQINGWASKMVPLLEELTLNVDLYGNQAEGQELLMFLVGWMNSWNHYSPVSTPEQREVVLNGLVTRLENLCKVQRSLHPEWRTFGPGWQPSANLDTLVTLLENQNKPVDPSQTVLPEGDLMF